MKFSHRIGKTFVLGDIHGAYRALRQCLERARFSYEDDHLICLGDVCDGWPETKMCIEELMKIKELSYIMGNHDFMTLDWMKSGRADEGWLVQGGEATQKSYEQQVPPSHLAFLDNARAYLEVESKLFVHAGFDPSRTLESQDLEIFLWDRRLARLAMESYEKKQTHQLTPFEEVYLGHTPIPFDKPIYSGGVWLMDTGAGWSGVLSMMDVTSKEVFTSDRVTTLYPGVKGRSVNRF